MESSSSSNASDEGMIQTDLERNVQEAQERQPRRLVRVWMVSGTLLRGHRVSALACVMTVL